MKKPTKRPAPKNPKPSLPEGVKIPRNRKDPRDRKDLD